MPLYSLVLSFTFLSSLHFIYYLWLLLFLLHILHLLYSRHASANSHFSFRLLCFTQVLLRCEMLFSLNRSSELSFSSGPAFFAHPCYHQAMVVYSQGAQLLVIFFFVARWRERTADRNSVSQQREPPVDRGGWWAERWMCRSAGRRLVV